MKPMVQRYRTIGLLVVAIILCVAGLAYAGKPPRHLIAAGTEAFSVLEDEVMSLTFTTARYTLTARRSRPAAPFAVHIAYSDGRSTQQCEASPSLAGQLPKFSTIVVKRQISPEQLKADFPAPLGSIEMVDRIVTQTPPVLVFRASKDGGAVALSYQGYAVEVSTPVAAFARFDGGCQALAAPRTTR